MKPGKVARGLIVVFVGLAIAFYAATLAVAAVGKCAEAQEAQTPIAAVVEVPDSAGGWRIVHAAPRTADGIIFVDRDSIPRLRFRWFCNCGAK